MTIRKQWVVFAAVLALLLTLCSCMSMEAGVVINADGTVRVYTEMAIQKSMLDEMGMTEEEFFEQSGDSDSFEGWERESFSKNIDGEKYTGIRYYKDGPFSLLSENALSDESGLENEMSFQLEGEDLVVRIVYRNDEADEGGETDDFAMYENQIQMKFRLSVPFTVVETNGEIGEDGSVCWDLTDVFMGRVNQFEITARFRVGSNIGALFPSLFSEMNTEFGVTVNTDRTARAYAEIAVPKRVFGEVGLSEEEFFGMLGGSDSFADWESERFSKDIDGEEYTGIRYNKDSPLDFLSENGLSSGSELGTEMSFQREGGDYLVRVVYRSSETGYAVQGAKAKFRLSVPFPASETNGEIGEDGSICWDLTDVFSGNTDQIEMTARFQVGPDIGTILLIAGGILLGAVLIVVIAAVIRHRPKPLAASAETERSYVPTETETAAGEAASMRGEIPAESPKETVPAQTAPERAKTPAEKRFCSNCGARLEEGDAFCSSCGAKV